ncbi:MAG TPA: Lrp/AsnC family transcriptional regulator [Thiobacillus sp.]|nr:Lrp/AsnC family transcriptional regulator [Thiobacillus sp.]
MDSVDFALVAACQAGLPLTPRPYHAMAEQLGLGAEEVMARMQAMMQAGVIRRIGVVPNHYALGYTANGMTVWDVADEHVDALGEAVGRLPFVSHCYCRPRHLPLWPYNLFAMVHAKSRGQAQAYADQIGDLLGVACRQSDILYSSRMLKKTGLRIAD